MFTPNLDCWITPAVDESHNRYGEPQKGTRRKERCSIVRLRNRIQHTTVRADSGGSRGHGDENTTENSSILLTPATRAVLDDKLEVSGVFMRIVSMFPRYDVTGKLDHYEVSGETWA